jgi:hypothetical protein
VAPLRGSPDPVETAERPEDHAAPYDGRRRHAEIVDLVPAKYPELRTSLDDKRHAFFTQAEDAAVVGPRGAREVAARGIDALSAVEFSSRLSIVASEEALVEQRVVTPFVDQR